MENMMQKRGMPVEDKKVAVYIDFENVAISAEESFDRLKTEVLIQTAEQFGRCISKRAYGDWTRFSRYSQDLLDHSIEATQLFHYNRLNDKNAADIQMVSDILEMLFTRPEVEVFVLATGDSDFSAVVRKLRSYGKYVVGIGLKQATSEVLVNACDQFLFYDTIVDPTTRTQSYSLEQARQLLLTSMTEMTRQSGSTHVLAATLKNQMLQKDPTFNQVRLGFSQFRDFIAQQEDMVELGSRENQLIVSLNSGFTEKASRDPLLEYRTALDREGLLLLDPYTRVDVLRDLFRLLKENPQRYTLLEAGNQLKAKYDSTNIFRSRDEVHEAIKLVRYVEVISPTPQSWELDPLSIVGDMDMQKFVDLCESVYVAALVTRNLKLNPGLIAKLLFGTADSQPRVNQLITLVKSKAESRAKGSVKAQAWQLPEKLGSKGSLKLILEDVENFQLDSEPTLENATLASENGMKVRSTDFEAAKLYYLEAAKIVYLLLQKGAPGASLVDLEWQLSSYCASAAGAAFYRHDYEKAIGYYLAFFSIAIETDPVWEKVNRLASPMLSFYFTIAANQEQTNLNASPGQRPPTQIVSMILDSPNPQVQERGRELAAKLAGVNPALLRNMIQRLEAVTSQSNGERNSELKAQDILSEILHEHSK